MNSYPSCSPYLNCASGFCPNRVDSSTRREFELTLMYCGSRTYARIGLDCCSCYKLPPGIYHIQGATHSYVYLVSLPDWEQLTSALVSFTGASGSIPVASLYHLFLSSSCFASLQYNTLIPYIFSSFCH
jgi:hypothetical protein